MNITPDKEFLARKYRPKSLRYRLHLMARIIKHLYHPQKKRLSTSVNIHGINNSVNYVPTGLSVTIFGNNNCIEIAPSTQTFYGNITIGALDTPVNNCTVKLGERCYCNGCNIVLYEPNSSVIIGNDCMFSFGIEIWASDSHSIIDQKTKQLLNLGKEIFIGNHVWVGMRTTILKNSHISNDCIIGAGAIVAGKFTEEHCVIAGNPAKIVKRGISWDGLRPCEYQMKHKF